LTRTTRPELVLRVGVWIKRIARVNLFSFVVSVVSLPTLIMSRP